MLDRLRGRMERQLLGVGRFLARLRLSPLSLTVLGLFFAFLSAVFFSTGSPGGQFLGGFFLLISGFFDLVDGAVARVTGKETKRGAFLDSTLDRLGEVVVYLGLIGGGYLSPGWILLALGLSLLVSYERARAEALGTQLAGVGVGERGERLLVLAVLSLFTVTSLAIIVVVVLAGFTFLQRMYRAVRAL